MNNDILALLKVYNNLTSRGRTENKEALDCVKKAIAAYPHDFTPDIYKILLSVLIDYDFKLSVFESADIRNSVLKIFKDNSDIFTAADFACILGLIDAMGINWGQLKDCLPNYDLKKALIKNLSDFSIDEIVVVIHALHNMGFGSKTDCFDEKLKKHFIETIALELDSLSLLEMANMARKLIDMGFKWSDVGPEMYTQIFAAVQNQSLIVMDGRGNTDILQLDNIVNAIDARQLLDSVDIQQLLDFMDFIFKSRIGNSLELRLSSLILAALFDRMSCLNPKELASVMDFSQRMGVFWMDMPEERRQQLLSAIVSKADLFDKDDIAAVMRSSKRMVIIWFNLPTDVQNKLLTAIGNNASLFNTEDTISVISYLDVNYLSMPKVVQIGLLNAISRNVGLFEDHNIAFCLTRLRRMGWSKMPKDFREQLLLTIGNNAYLFSKSTLDQVMIFLQEVNTEWSSIPAAVQHKLLTAIGNMAHLFDSDIDRPCLLVSCLHNIGVKWTDIPLEVQTQLLTGWIKNKVHLLDKPGNGGIVSIMMRLGEIGAEWSDIPSGVQTELLGAIGYKAFKTKPEASVVAHSLRKMGVKWIDISSIDDENIPLEVQTQLLTAWIENNKHLLDKQGNSGIVSIMISLGNIGAKWSDMPLLVQTKMFAAIDDHQLNSNDVRLVMASLNGMDAKWSNIPSMAQTKLAALIDNNVSSFDKYDIVSIMGALRGMGALLSDIPSSLQDNSCKLKTEFTARYKSFYCSSSQNMRDECDTRAVYASSRCLP